MKSIILDLHNKLIKKKLSPKRLVNSSLKIINKYKKTNFVLYKNSLEAQRLAKHFDNQYLLNKSFLSCIPYALKDNISTKGIVTTGGSKFLENYIPPYDSTVHNLLKKAGAILVAKTNLDEFGLGGTGSFSAFGIVSHPFHKKHIAGGSSSGSAVAVACGAVPFSIGTDTGDSVRRPASFCGIIGFKPTYGLISRYGVYPYAPSFDHVGVFTKTIADAAIVSDQIIAFDENDFTSQKKEIKLFEALNKNLENFTIGFPSNIEAIMSEEILTAWNQLKSHLASNGINIVPVNLDLELIKVIDPVYKILSYAEAASCYSNLTGIPFGNKSQGNSFEDLAKKTRNVFFGEQLKRRFTIGSFALKKENFEKYYLKSKKVRAKITNHFNDILNSVDAFLTVGASSFSPLIKDVLNGTSSTSSILDDILQLANFGGQPSVTIPFAKNSSGLDLGLNLTSVQFSDAKLLQIALAIENILDLRGSIRV